jgi:hypothetical protein
MVVEDGLNSQIRAYVSALTIQHFPEKISLEMVELEGLP